MDRTAAGSPVKLLVSVRNVAEARDAVSAGVDIIDIKEPSRGPLGRADAGVIEAIARAVPRSHALSVALGELTDAEGESASEPMPSSVTYAKMGLLGAPQYWRRQMTRAFSGWAQVRPVAVAYADRLDAGGSGSTTCDHPPLADILEWAIENRAAGLLVDTTIKDGRNLFDFMEDSTILGLRKATRSAGLFLALAGSLRKSSFERAVGLEPEIVAVRGAACTANQREQSIDPARIRDLLVLIAAHHSRTRPVRALEG